MTSKTKKVLEAKRDALDYLDKILRVNSRNSIKNDNFGKPNSARLITSKTTPKDDLILTTEHTILNIRANQDPSDYEFE